jgi:hypothetical protein
MAAMRPKLVLTIFAGMLGACGPVDTAGVADGSVEQSTGGSSGAAELGGSETTGETFADSSGGDGAEPPLPLDCDQVPTSLGSARWWASMPTEHDGGPIPFAAIAGGGAVWIVDEQPVSVQSDGEIGTPVVLAASEHATAVVGTPHGTAVVAGWRNAGASGEVDAFLLEYASDGTRGAETSWGVEPDANETPIAMVTSPSGHIAVLTKVGFDATMPGAAGFVRLDRFDPALALVHSLDLVAPPADLAIDDEGNAYLVAIGGASVGIVAIDRAGATLWEAFEPADGTRVAVAIGAELLWVVQNSDDGFGGGTLRARGRMDGVLAFAEPFVADDLSMPIEIPIDVAASPCGGAWMVGEASYEAETFVTLSYFGEDGTRSEVTSAPQPSPVAGTHYSDIVGIDSGSDGTVVVAGRLFSAIEYHAWSIAF